MNWTIIIIETAILVLIFTAAILSSILLSLLIWPTGADSFLSALAVSYGMWLVIDWYDCFFLDWVLFANVKTVRLPDGFVGIQLHFYNS